MKSLLASVAVLVLTTQTVHATLETAEVLPPGVPNFILEGQYGLNQSYGTTPNPATSFGMSYHFGVGFEIASVPFDIDIFRRFGPSFATESVILLETQALNRSWRPWIPVELSVLYGVAMKSDDIRKAVQGKSTVYGIRHGLAVSRHFRSKIFRFTPFFTWIGDVDVNNRNRWAGHISFGVGAMPWFFEKMRVFIEGQVNLKNSLSMLTCGLEFVLVPKVQGLDL